MSPALWFWDEYAQALIVTQRAMLRDRLRGWGRELVRREIRAAMWRL